MIGYGEVDNSEILELIKKDKKIITGRNKFNKWILRLSNEEIANFFDGIGICPSECNLQETCGEGKSCKECWEKALDEEV